MNTTITRNKTARLHLAAANADAALALDTPPTGFDLIEAIIFGGYEPGIASHHCVSERQA